MNLPLGIALFFLIWWVVLFAVLPFGLRTQEEGGEVVPGTPESAPASPKLLRLFALNTVVAAVVFGCVWFVIDSGLVTIDTFALPGQITSPPATN